MRSLLARAQLGLPSYSKGQRPQGLATVALVLLLLQGIAHAQLSVPITTEREFYNALRDDDVTEVQVRNDIVLQADTWSGDGVVVRRSVNVTGAGANMPAIDFSYLSKKCVLATNVTIAFKKVMIRQTRYQLQSIAAGYDFFDKTEPPWATVYLDQAVSRFRACLPFDIAAAAASKLSRPVEWQGTQNVSETAVDPFCRTLPNGQQECWQYTGAQYDLAVEAATTNSVGNYLSAGYALVTHDSLYVCDVLMTTECINTYGAGNCFTRTGSMPAPPPTYRPGYTAAPSSKGASSTSVIAIAVPAAVGGCAVIALVVGLAVWNRRRRKQAFSSLPIRSTANGTGHTNGHSRGPTSDGQTAPPTGRTPGGSANSQGPALGRADDIHPSLSGSDPKYHKSADMFSGMESDWNKTDVFEDNPLTAVVMEQDPHLPTLRLEIDFLTEIQLIEGSERGTGSFGRVVEGIYKGERVAVKMIHPAMVGNSARSLKTFKQEVDILGKCRHRNIVQLIGACLTPPHIFLVEELMACSLDTLVHDHNKQFPLEQLLLIARDIACGLAYLHPTIIHRDLKPANVLLDQNGTAKLTDFGLARLRDCTLVTKHPEAGTAPYVAPECFDTSNYTITDKADMYSFAVVLWEMLSRASPWRGETPLAVAYKVTISKERLPLNMDESRCPRKLRKLIEECWDPDPRRRPSAAVAAKQLTLVLQQLQAAQDGTSGVNSFQTHNSKESA